MPTANVAPFGITEERLEAAVAPVQCRWCVVALVVALLVSPLTPPERRRGDIDDAACRCCRGNW